MNQQTCQSFKPMKNRARSVFFRLCASLVFVSSSALSEEIVNRQPNDPTDIAATAGGSFLQELVVLMVDKTNLKAELRTWPAKVKNSQLLKTFTVAIGKEKGDKERTGDNKTPEGIYMTQDILEGKSLPAKYGPNAITLNYPNPFDRTFGKTGYGIWLHGVIKDERVEEANVTEGCVAFYNSDIVQLTDWLRPYQGFVIIAEDATRVNDVNDLKNLKSQTESWAQAWAKRDIETYSSFYAPEFEYKGMDLASYREYKSRVFKSYHTMNLDVNNLRVMTHPKYAVAIMDQDFSGDDRFVSHGRKILYWHKRDGNWKIIREVYEDRRLEFVRFTPSENSHVVVLDGRDGREKSL